MVVSGLFPSADIPAASPPPPPSISGLRICPLLCRSLALVDDDDISNRDGTLKALNCTKFDSFLPAHVLKECTENAFVLSAVTKGVRRALYTCQTLLRHNKWRCTTFTQQYLLGKAVETKGVSAYPHHVRTNRTPQDWLCYEDIHTAC